MKKNLFASVLLLVFVSGIPAYAADPMGDMNMMSEQFNTQMQKTDSMAKKMLDAKGNGKNNPYMLKHMQQLQKQD